MPVVDAPTTGTSRPHQGARLSAGLWNLHLRIITGGERVDLGGDPSGGYYTVPTTL